MLCIIRCEKNKTKATEGSSKPCYLLLITPSQTIMFYILILNRRCRTTAMPLFVLPLCAMYRVRIVFLTLCTLVFLISLHESLKV